MLSCWNSQFGRKTVKNSDLEVLSSCHTNLWGLVGVFFFPLLGLSVVPVLGQAAHLKSQSIFILSLARVILTADVKKNLPRGNQKHMQNKFGERLQEWQRGNVFNEILQECWKPVVQEFQPTDENSNFCKYRCITSVLCHIISGRFSGW